MNGNNDAIDDILAAFADHLEHGTPRPALDRLNPHDRRLAEDLMPLLETGRRIDPSASAPSLEALLADTEFADVLPLAAPRPEAQVLHRMRDLLTRVDSRADVHVDDEGFVSFGYLDLLARFHPLETDDPSLPDTALRAVFDADAYVDLVALVATQTGELLTRVVSRYDVDPTISTAVARPAPLAPVVLPLGLAARAILEQSAPEWGEFGVDRVARDLVDVADLELDIATRVVAEEAKRRYQGDKAVAYRGLVGHEHRLVELITAATRQGEPVDFAAEVDHLVRQVS